MRTYDEPLDVRLGRVGAEEGPEQFLWRGRLWRVCEIEARWLETGAWWDSPRVRAARGDDVTAGSPPGDSDDGDLLAEHEIWRVVAARGPSSDPGVYELDHAWGTGRWRLRAVVD